MFSSSLLAPPLSAQRKTVWGAQTVLTPFIVKTYQYTDLVRVNCSIDDTFGGKHIEFVFHRLYSAYMNPYDADGLNIDILKRWVLATVCYTAHLHSLAHDGH